MSVTEVIRILILIGSVVLLSACGGGGGSGDPNSDPGTDVVIEPVDAADDTGSDETPVDQEPTWGRETPVKMTMDYLQIKPLLMERFINLPFWFLYGPIPPRLVRDG